MKTLSRITTRTTGNPEERYSFRRGERLSGRKAVSELFQSGHSIRSYPLRILYTASSPGRYPASMAVTVPKKSFKKSVDRNLLKRRIREAYRLYKPDFYRNLEKNRINLNLMVLYQHNEIEDFKTIQQGLQQGLESIIRSADNGTPPQAH